MYRQIIWYTLFAGIHVTIGAGLFAYKTAWDEITYTRKLIKCEQQTHLLLGENEKLVRILDDANTTMRELLDAIQPLENLEDQDEKI